MGASGVTTIVSTAGKGLDRRLNHHPVSLVTAPIKPLGYLQVEETSMTVYSSADPLLER